MVRVRRRHEMDDGDDELLALVVRSEDRRRAAGDRQAALYERRLNFEIQKNRLEEAERNPEATRRAAKQSRVATDQAAAHVEQLALTKL